jgi:peptidoglycan/LPS O-acetylase OafA/YrhL
MSAPTISNTSRLPELDGLRALAILLVLLSHHLAFVPIASVRYVVEMGWIGVDLFFVLSGFLIGGILLDQRTTANYYRVFYLRRFFRIVPLYALLVIPGLLALNLGLQSHFAGHSMAHLAPYGMWLCVVFLQNFDAIFQFGIPFYLTPTWSVAVEEQFYLLLPPLVKNVDPKKLLKILVLLIISAPVLRGILIFTLRQNAGMQEQVARVCYMLLPCRWDSLLLGVVGAIAFRDLRFHKWMGMHLRRFQLLWCFSGLICLALLFCSDGRLDPKLGFLSYTLIDAWFASTLLLAVMNPSGGLHRFLSLPAFKPVAIVSYGLYLLQSPVAAVVKAFVLLAHLQYPEISWTATGLALLSLGLTAVAATISWKFLESRMIRMGHQYRYQPAALGRGN